MGVNVSMNKTLLAALIAVPVAANAAFIVDDAPADVVPVVEQKIESPKAPAAPEISPPKAEIPVLENKVSVEKTDASLGPVKQDRHLSQTGAILYLNQGSFAPPFAQGLGRDIPLGLAITQILQNPEWVVQAESMVNMRKAVSWKGGVPWTDALDDVLTQVGYSAEVDFAAKRVKLVAKGTPVEVNVWELDPADGSLRKSLEKWVKIAGWQLVWEADYDFPVSMYARIEGSLEDALYAVSSSIRGSEAPLKITLFEGNRVVRVAPADGGKRR